MRQLDTVFRGTACSILVGALLALLLDHPPVLAEPAPAASKPSVELQGSRLSVHFKDITAADAFKALDQKGVHIRASQAVLKQKITLSFDSLEVEQGMRRIVKAMSVPGYAVVYAKENNGSPTFVLFDAGKSLPPLPATAGEPSEAPLANAPQLHDTPPSTADIRQRERELQDRYKAEKKALKQERKLAHKAERGTFEERRARAMASMQNQQQEQPQALDPKVKALLDADDD